MTDYTCERCGSSMREPNVTVIGAREFTMYDCEKQLSDWWIQGKGKVVDPEVEQWCAVAFPPPVEGQSHWRIEGVGDFDLDGSPISHPGRR